MAAYIANIAPIANTTKCHTYDRKNIFAQLECGLGASTNTTDIKNFKIAADALFNMQYYTYTIT